MALYLLRQLGSSAVSFLLVVVGSFLLLRMFGDPTPLIIPEGTPEQIQEVRRQLGLEAPVLSQLAGYLGGLLQGDLGDSYYSQRPVGPAVLARMATTATLVVGGVLVAVLIGVPLGIVAAVKRNTFWDRLISTLTILGQSMPTFWTGLILILVFAVRLRWLPAFGVDSWKGWILPIATLATFSMARFTRIMRASLLGELNADYVRTARSKGLSEARVVGQSVRNALVPVLTLLGFRVAELITGSVVIEVVFSIPGMGQMLVNDGIFRRDFPVVQAGIMLAAALVIAINLVTEWTYSLVDPRIRY